MPTPFSVLFLLGPLLTIGGPPPASTPPIATGGVPAAMVDGRKVEWGDLLPALAEAAGGLVLEETVLGRRLEAECARVGLALPAPDGPEIAQERSRLGSTLASAANLPESDGEALLGRIRAGRGLGDVRFAGLLRRNAMLRALVRSGKESETVADVTDDDLHQAYSLKHGPKVKARMILVRSAPAAAEAVRRISPPSSLANPPESFAEVAAQVSLDPSAARGGLLDPFSLDDATYPVAVRRTISALQPGGLSDPVEVSWGANQGYAILRLEQTIPTAAGAPRFEEAAESLRAEVRLVRERAAMDRLARRLVEAGKITIFDRGLNRSWNDRAPQP